MEHSQAIVRPSLENIYQIGAEDGDRRFRELWLAVRSLAALTAGTFDRDAIFRSLVEKQ